MKVIFVNDRTFGFSDEHTILQFLHIWKFQIPRFCYHEQLSIAGNCRMCLIEDVKSVKPVIACGVNITDGLAIYTESVKVKKAREAVLEYLLINHPLDCPICDQGGECDLQDLSLIVGGDKGRFYEVKRAVTNKNFGYLIKTVMNRCIHCTRCVRFATEVAGVSMLGLTGRGSSMEIGFYVDVTFDSNISGNVIDLCPVGALTSKPYSYMFRPWEFKTSSFIDIFADSLEKVLIDLRGFEIMRIVPYYDYGIGSGFISDYMRFTFDSNSILRQTLPVYICKGIIIRYNWRSFFVFLQRTLNNILSLILLNKIKNLTITGLVDVYSDLNFLYKFQSFLYSVGSKSLFKVINIHNGDDVITTTSNFLVLNTNLRVSNPLINIKLRKRFLENANFYYIGSRINTLFFMKHIANSNLSFFHFMSGKMWLSLVKTSIISSILEFNKDIYYACLRKFNIPFMIFKTLSTSTQQYSFLDNKLSLTYINLKLNFGFDSMLSKFNKSFKNTQFYAGHHKDIGVLFSNIICPSLTIFEKSSVYYNYINSLVKVSKVVPAPLFARSDVEILSLLSRILCKHFLDKQFNFDEFNTRASFVFNKIRYYNTLFNKNYSVLASYNVFIKNSRVFIK